LFAAELLGGLGDAVVELDKLRSRLALGRSNSEDLIRSHQ